jgi:predicted PurR-regulated permease PerM
MAETARKIVQQVRGDAAEASPEAAPRVDVNVRSVALIVIAVAAAMYLLQWASEVFIPIVLSILISYALEPIVLALIRIRIPRLVASALVVASLAGAFGYSIYALTDDATAIVSSLPEAATKLRQAMREQPSAIDDVQRAARELQRTADEAAGKNPAPNGVQRVQIEEPAIDVKQYLSWGSVGIIAFAGQAVLVAFFVFFLLASGDLFKRKFVKLAGPSLEQKKITVQILNEIDLQIERFLFVRVVTSVAVGVTSWLAFRFIGLEQAGVWGFAAGVFNSFLQFGTIGMAAYVSAVSLAITSVEGWLITPWLTSRTARTNEVAIFVGLIFWSFVWGIWGTLLAVPMLVAVKACCDRIEDLKPIGELLGE